MSDKLFKSAAESDRLRKQLMYRGPKIHSPSTRNKTLGDQTANGKVIDLVKALEEEKKEEMNEEQKLY